MRNLNLKLAALLAVVMAAPAVNGRQPTPCQQQQGIVEDMEAAVSKSEAGDASAKTLIGEFAKYVEAHKNDPTALQAFVDRLNTSADSLAAAVTANPDPDSTD